MDLTLTLKADIVLKALLTAPTYVATITIRNRWLGHPPLTLVKGDPDPGPCLLA